MALSSCFGSGLFCKYASDMHFADQYDQYAEVMIEYRMKNVLRSVKK